MGSVEELHVLTVNGEIDSANDKDEIQDDDDDDSELLDYDVDFASPLLYHTEVVCTNHTSCKLVFDVKICLSITVVAILISSVGLIVYYTAARGTCKDYESEICGKEWLQRFNNELAIRGEKMAELDWNDAVNITEVNSMKKLKYSNKIEKWIVKKQNEAKKFSWRMFKDGLTKRAFKGITRSIALKKDSDRKRLTKLSSQCSDLYNLAKACVKVDNCIPEGLCLDVGEQAVQNFLKIQRPASKYDCIAQVWDGWRNATGRKLLPLIEESLKLVRQGAEENGVDDPARFEWFNDFETNRFDQDVIQLFEQIKPLYEQLHAYVRGKLARYYPNRFRADGLIPAHILGDNWAQSWENIYPLLNPFPQLPNVDITAEMKRRHEQNRLSVKDMFLMAEDFFVSMGLPKMTEDFWHKSLFKKPSKDSKRVVDCHGSAHTISNRRGDYRIKMCTEIDQENLYVIHHEMGHIEYYMAYAQQMTVFQEGANSGFHEAIGDTIALSVNTPQHYRRVGLLPKATNKTFEEDKKREIQFLLQQALFKVAFLPFALSVDAWRWHALNGTARSGNMNYYWWRLRSQLQGIGPPVKRTEQDLDPASKYHVALGIPYIRYYVSFIIQFQFFKAMCDASGHPANQPLHTCDFYQSKEAGTKLRNMMMLGSSKPWQEAMEVLTGSKSMNTAPILKYFEPLFEWLKSENVRNNFHVGWSVPVNPMQAVADQ